MVFNKILKLNINLNKYLIILINTMAENKTKASETILQVTGDHRNEFNLFVEMFKAWSTEIKGEIGELKTAVQLLQSSKSKSGGAKKAASTGTPNENKPLSNSMYWFRKLWMDNRDAAIQKYCNSKDFKKALEEYNNTKDAKGKSGTQKVDAEFKHMWSKYIKGNSSMKDKISKDYKVYVEDFKRKNMTPVNKDSEPVKEKKNTKSKQTKSKKNDSNKEESEKEESEKEESENEKPPKEKVKKETEEEESEKEESEKEESDNDN